MKDETTQSNLVAELLSRGVEEADARDIAAIVENSPPENLLEMRSLLGEPDRIIEWNAALEECRSRAEREHHANVRQWSRIFRYTRRWQTIHLDIIEHNDGTLGMMIGQEKKEEAREQ